MRSYLSAAELARFLGVDRATVTRWIKHGRIRGVYRPDGTQNWRIPLSTCAQIKQHQNENNHF
ncbi:MAG: helix-turn-helix domain-containing protein [Chloroflexota bacterium]